MSGKFLLLPQFVENPVFIANLVDPDQMPRSVASDKGLHRLLVSLLGDARHKCFKCVLRIEKVAFITCFCV